MSAVLFRAPLFNPAAADGLQWWSDGALLMRDGRIAASGPFDAVGGIAGSAFWNWTGSLPPDIYPEHRTWLLLARH